MRWIVLLITTIALLGGARPEAPRTVSPRSARLEPMKSLPAAAAVARRARSVSHVRLPAFALAAASVPIASARRAIDRRSVALRGHGPARLCRVAARGPPRG